MTSPNEIATPFDNLDLSKIPDAPKLKSIYDSVADEKPEQAAKVLTLAQLTGQHPAFVSANMPQAQQAADTPPPDLFSEIEKNHPAATKFLSDPANMAVAQHDLPNVAQHSQLIENAKKEFGFLDAVKVGLQGSVPGLAIRQQLPEAMPSTPSLKLGLGKQIGGIVGDFVPMMAGSALGGAAGAAAGAVAGAPGGPLLEFAGTAGGAILGAGAGSFALPAALRQALTDEIGKGNPKGLQDALERAYSILKESGKQGIVGALTSASGGAAKLASIGPLATLAAENAAMTAAGNAVEGKMPKLSELGHQFVENAVVLGAMHGAGAASEHLMGKWAEAKRVDAEQNFYKAMGQTAEASKLMKLMPDAHQDLIRRLTDGSPVSDVHVPVQAWDNHFQTTGFDPKDAAHRIGVGASYTEAKLTGGNVKVPLDTFIAKMVGTPHYAALAGDVKFSEDGFTLNQLNEQDTQEREKIEKAQTALQPMIEKDIKASAQEKGIFADLHKQLQESGVLKGSKQYEAKLKDAATLASRHYAVEAQLRGMEPQALYDQVKNQFNSAETATGGQEQANPNALQQGNPFQRMIQAITGPTPGQGNLPETRQEEMVLAPARYSKMIQTLDQKIQGKSATVEQVRALASNFKEDERKWTGLDKFLEGKSGQVPKAELIDFLNKNMIQVEDRVTGEKTPEAAEAEKGMAKTGEAEPTRGGLPHIDTLEHEELEEKVKAQYSDEINDRASEIESEKIDSEMDEISSEWKVTAEPHFTEAQEINDINEVDGLPGHWLVDFDHGGSKTYEAEDEEAARDLAESDLNFGLIEDNEDGYKLMLNGAEYSNRRIDTFYRDRREAENAAERATEITSYNYREGLDGNSNGSEYKEASDEYVQDILDGNLPLDGYSNGAEGGGDGKPNEGFKWAPARYKDTGNMSSYVLKGAEPDSFREIIFHVPQLEEYNASDKTHFGDISKGKDIGWTRTAIHLDDTGTPVRLANEFQNNRTQKGAAEGFKSAKDDAAWIDWDKNLDALKKERGNTFAAYQARQSELQKIANEEIAKEHPLGAEKAEFDALDEKAQSSVLTYEENNRWIALNRKLEDYRQEVNAKFNSLRESLWQRRNAEGVPYSENIYDLRDKGSLTQQEADALQELDRGSFQSKNFKPVKDRENDPQLISLVDKKGELDNQISAHEASEPKKGNVPDTPFKNNSYEFQFKGLLRWNVEQDFNAWKASGSKEPFIDWWKENGIKKVGWTTGMQQAERNNRVDDVDKLVYDPVKQELSAYNNGVNKINGAKMKPEEIADKLGGSPQAKEIVKRLLATELAKPSNTLERLKELETKVERTGKDLTGAELDEANALKTKVQSGEDDHAGMHVIHDEGGIKVAANAKFYQDLYDMKIPSFVKKFSKQWGGTVGEAMIKTGEQEGAVRYEGNEPGLLKLKKVGTEIASGHSENLKNNMRDLVEGMKAGKSFSDAIARVPMADTLAAMFDGKMVKDTATRFENVHALTVTPEMARAAITQGFPLFQAAGAEGPLGEYNPAQKLISFFKQADVTTIPHELAHAWIEDAFQFVKSGQANEDYLKHWQAAKDWLGVKDDQDSLTRDQHEKFAQGFEKYMMEGKAPSDSLKSVFYRMAQWMTQVYKQVKNALRGGAVKGIELSDSARGFMDRLLATDEEIASAAKDAGYNPADIHGVEEADPVGQKRVRTLQERAHEQAVETLVRQKMEEIRAGNAQAYDQERQRVTAQHFNEVANEPVFRAYSLFNPEGTEERITQPGIWKEAHGYLNGKLDHETTAKWDTIAEMSGFSDATEMAHKLLLTERAPAFEKALNEKINASMAQFSALKDPQAIRDAATAAIHNEHSTELLALEQKVLGDLTQKKEMSAEISKRNAVSAREQAASAKKNAADILAAKPVKESAAFRPYIKAERDAAIRVSKAIAAKDYEAAAQAKGEQMLNHALYAEAFKNSKLVAKMMKTVDKYASRGNDLMGMPFGFMQQIDGLLATTGLTDPKPDDSATMVKIAQAMQDKKSDPSEIANATGMLLGEDGKWRKERLPEFVERVNENYYAMQLPDSMTDPVHRQTFPQGMTLADFRDLTDTMKTIGTVGRTFEHFLSSFIRGDLKTNAAALRAKIEANIGTPYGNNPLLGEVDRSKFQKAVDWIKGTPDGMIQSKVNLLTLCEYLDRQDPEGPAKNNIYRPLERAWNDEADLRATKSKELDSIRSRFYTPKELKKFGDTFARWQIDTPDGKKNVKLTRENAILLLLNRGSESNLDRLTRGFNVNEEQVKALTDGLSKKDHDFAQAVLDYVNTFWPQAKALEIDVNGVDPVKVQPKPIESAHGTYAGGYYPLAYDFLKSADAYKNAVQRNALYKQYTTTAAHTEQGALQQRVQTLARPVRLDFSGLYNHLDDVIHDITHRRAIIDVSRFLNQPDAKSAIMNAIGQDGYRKIGEDLKAVASSQTEFLMPGEQAVRWFRFATTFATLGYRFAIAPRRLTEDSVNALREVGFRNLAGSIGDTLQSPNVIREFVQANSPLMRDRNINREADFVQLSKQWQGKDSAVKRFAFLQDTVMDQALSYPVWKSTYDHALAKYGADRARELADEAIVKTFGSGRELDRVGAQRGGELNRMMSMYYSWHSMMFNRAWLQGKIAGLEYKEGNYGKALAIVASTAATTWLIPAAVNSLWSETLRNNQGDDEEARKKRVIGKFAEAPFEYFPMGRNIAGTAIPLLVGERGHGYQLSPLETAAESVITAAAHGGQIMLGNKELDQKYAEEALRALSIPFGAPQQLSTWVFNFIDFLNKEGETNWRDMLTRRTQK